MTVWCSDSVAGCDVIVTHVVAARCSDNVAGMIDDLHKSSRNRQQFLDLMLCRCCEADILANISKAFNSCRLNRSHQPATRGAWLTWRYLVGSLPPLPGAMAAHL